MFDWCVVGGIGSKFCLKFWHCWQKNKLSSNGFDIWAQCCERFSVTKLLEMSPWHHNLSDDAVWLVAWYFCEIGLIDWQARCNFWDKEKVISRNTDPKISDYDDNTHSTLLNLNQLIDFHENSYERVLLPKCQTENILFHRAGNIHFEFWIIIHRLRDIISYASSNLNWICFEKRSDWSGRG